MGVQGKVALVTGAGRHLGRAIALAFARQGAVVVVNVRTNTIEGGAVVREVEALGSRGLLVTADISEPRDVDRMFVEIDAAFHRVDVLVNNASLRPSTPFLDMSDEEWHRVLGVGLNGAFYCSRAAARGMAERRSGSIVNIVGATGFIGAKGRAHVVATKAGLHGLTKALAHDLGEFGIRVNSVDPSWMDQPTPSPEGRAGDVAARTPLGRAPTPDDVANTCLFLASDAAASITGQVIHVNGGLYMW